MQSHVNRRRRTGRREGSALIIVMLMVMSLMTMALLVSQDALGRSKATIDETGATQALWAAEAGIGIKVNDLESTAGAAMDSLTLNLADGAVCTVECEEVGQYVRITAVGVANPNTAGEVRRSIEAFVNPSFHPLFYKATYVGNGDANGLVDDYALTFGPNLPTVQGGSSFNESNWYGRNTAMSEVDHQVDFNADGDLGDAPTLRQIYDNRVAWGWSGHVQSSGNSRKLDINRNGNYTDTVVAPTVSNDPTPRDPSLDNPAPTTDTGWAGATPEVDADYIEGDVYVNGNLTINGGTNVFGDVDASGDGDTGVAGPDGEVTGAPVTGTSTSQSSYIAPPNLADPLGNGQGYESIADEIVTTDNLTGYVRGEQGASTYGDALGPAGTHDNPYFHLQNGSSSTLSFGNSRDGDLILIKGNLWIHDTSAFTIDMPQGSDVRITIVVEGNLYIADDLNYTNGQNGILFIVKGSDTDPESYIDENRNYQYDDGEQLMHDDGDGVYEGPIEGQGNVFFGDPRFGTGGVTDGYIYAQNNVYMVNPPTNVEPPSAAQDRIFGVYGFLSAGGIMDLGARSGGSNYNNFRVKYDPRIQNGTISFKGMPSTLGGGWQGLSVLSWREVQ